MIKPVCFSIPRQIRSLSDFIYFNFFLNLLNLTVSNNLFASTVIRQNQAKQQNNVTANMVSLITQVGENDAKMTRKPFFYYTLHKLNIHKVSSTFLNVVAFYLPHVSKIGDAGVLALLFVRTVPMWLAASVLVVYEWFRYRLWLKNCKFLILRVC